MTAKSVKSLRAEFAEHGLDIRSVRGAAREINRLIGELRHEQNKRLAAEQDVRRMDWLEANASYELRLRPGQVERWWTRYVSFHSWVGSTIREAVDRARGDFPV